MSSHFDNHDPAAHVHGFTLVVGDWSLDGHNQSTKFAVYGNVATADLSATLHKGLELSGLVAFWDADYGNLVFCSGYEDRTVPEEARDLVAKVFAAGYAYDNEWITSEDWTELHIGLLKLGNPAARFSVVRLPFTLNVGGYGLFS